MRNTCLIWQKLLAILASEFLFEGLLRYVDHLVPLCALTACGARC